MVFIILLVSGGVEEETGVFEVHEKDIEGRQNESGGDLWTEVMFCMLSS